MRSDDVLARASETLDRVRQQEMRKNGRIAKLGRRAVRATKYAIGGAFAVLVIALITGIFIPLGITGILLTFLAMMAAMCLGVFLSGEPAVKVESLPQIAIAQLPDQASGWLGQQRKLLPPPAQRLADGIGLTLEQLSPQLHTLNDQEPAAATLRRLIAEELPELVNGYQRVPQHLRAQDVSGLTPDKQLVNGLTIVDSELKRMSEQIARGDLTQLATQSRYLEIKYQGDR
jgi:hypothetical protein